MDKHHLENLFRGFHLLDYSQMCEIFDLDGESTEAKEKWQEWLEADRAIRQFYQSELEAVALYFHKLKEVDPRFR